MDSCCRICRRKELKDFFSLNYQSDFYSETGETVLEMINFSTGLNVALGDKLPQQLCRVCTGTLVAGYELRQLCLESDAYFRQALQADSQKLSKEDALSSDQINDVDFESCLTLGQIKLEPSVDADDTVTDQIDMNLGYNDNGSADKCYCCFPNCNVNYQFAELLMEHAASDHQMEKEANAAECNDSEFCCIVCAKAFTDEVELLKHRNQKNVTLQTDSKRLHEKPIQAHKSKDNVCACGFKSTRALSFRHHQGKCAMWQRNNLHRQQKFNARLQEYVVGDKTNDEIVAMGFRLNRHSTMFYCCISHCATVCETQQQLCDHFQQFHPEVREENMEKDSSCLNVFRCSICLTGFPEDKALQIHLEDAYSPTFRCNTCRYNCLSRKNAILHASMPCRAKLHQCSCGYSTPYTYSIKRHMKVLGCPQEGSSLRKFKTRPTKSKDGIGEKFEFGGETRKTEILYKCKNCEKSYCTVASLRRHTESELSRVLVKQEAYDPGKIVEGSAQKQYTCRWCKMTTEDTNHLVQCMVKAEKDAGEELEHKCSSCDKKFKIYNQYLEHRNNQICTQKTWLFCKPCGVKFPTRKKLTKHLSNFHHKPKQASKPKKHECKDCLHRFVTAYTLNRHRRSHHQVDANCGETPEMIKNE